MNKKLRVGSLWGSIGEHEVSLMSSTSIINALDKKVRNNNDRNNPAGAWKYYDGPIDGVITGEWEKTPETWTKASTIF